MAPKEEKKFRLKSKNIAFTYSAIAPIDAPPPDLKIWLAEIRAIYDEKKIDIVSYIVSRERHEDNSWHIHAWTCSDKEFETRSCHAFNINGKRPSFKPMSEVKREGWLNYIRKDGDYIEENAPPMTGDGKKKSAEPWKNYSRNKRDKAEWEQDENLKKLEDIKWPLDFAGIKIEKPDPSNKKRHIYVWGPPTMQKTRTMQDLLVGKKAYIMSDDPATRWERYAAEELCIGDDIHHLGDKEWSSVTETWRMVAEVPGKPRYFSRYWPIGVTRTILFLSNDPPPPMDAFHARFQVFYLAEYGGKAVASKSSDSDGAHAPSALRGGPTASGGSSLKRSDDNYHSLWNQYHELYMSKIPDDEEKKE